MKTSLFAIAFSAVTLTSVTAMACSDIPNPTRFMPTELSDYQICVLDKGDETSGVIGNLAWVRLHDGTYFSTQLREVMLKANGDTAAAVEIVTEYIIQEVEAEVKSVEEQLRDLGVSERKIANKLERMIVRKLAGDNFSLSDGYFYGRRHDNDASGYTIDADQAGNIANYAANNGIWPNAGMVRDILVNSMDPAHVEFRAKLQAYIEEAVSTAWSAGYDAGYEDGYNDGYRDGYADGYADGVASQQ